MNYDYINTLEVSTTFTSGRYTESTRTRVIIRIANYLQSKGVGATDAYQYRFSQEDWQVILSDIERDGRWLTTVDAARRWWKLALEGRFQHLQRNNQQQAETRMTADVLFNLQCIVLSHPTSTPVMYRFLLFMETNQLFSSRHIAHVLKNKLGISRKKITYEKKEKFTLSNMNYYQTFTAIYKNIDRRRLVFVDQTGFDLFMFNPKYGYARNDERLIAPRSGEKGPRVNCTGLIAWDESRPPFFGAFTTESSTFDGWQDFVLNEALGVYLFPGDILVCDNWAGFVGENQGRVLNEILEEFGIIVWALPRYSPELNPIELLWNHMKGFLRKSGFFPRNIQEEVEALQQIFSNIQSCRGYFDHVDK